ncbi:hypothetical protein KIL84_005387 [Mauremys mutica]|uniref:Uncharacterized protein n=1 Tax=Mauremys mutica TaxID=74926 RepID=A0A9D3XKU9_9SAUR|nr:hypothetical protein KIL84_005387 [Mauremys mutica]
MANYMALNEALSLLFMIGKQETHDPFDHKCPYPLPACWKMRRWHLSTSVQPCPAMGRMQVDPGRDASKSGQLGLLGQLAAARRAGLCPQGGVGKSFQGEGLQTLVLYPA